MRVNLFCLVTTITAFYACDHSPVIPTPNAAIEKYQRFVLQMKADSISELFTADAEIAHGDNRPIKGRDSIYDFLASFKNIRVIENRDDISSVSVRGDSATVHGTYAQQVIVSGKDTVRVVGTFTAQMIQNKNRSWHIWKMRTRSL